MLDEGCFQDIDVALMMHGSPTTCTDVRSMACTEAEVIFTGKSAHAALKPDAGRSAFDALLLSFNGIEFLREHVLEDTRMHYTVLESPALPMWCQTRQWEASICVPTIPPIWKASNPGLRTSSGERP